MVTQPCDGSALLPGSVVSATSASLGASILASMRTTNMSALLTLAKGKGASVSRADRTPVVADDGPLSLHAPRTSALSRAMVVYDSARFIEVFSLSVTYAGCSRRHIPHLAPSPA